MKHKAYLTMSNPKKIPKEITIDPFAIDNCYLKQKMKSKVSNHTTHDSSNSEIFPQIYPTSSSHRTYTEDLSSCYNRTTNNKTKSNIPKCTLWKQNPNDSIYVNTLYKVNKDKQNNSAISTSMVKPVKKDLSMTTHLTNRSVVVKKRNNKIDHLIKNGMKTKFLRGKMELDKVDHNNIPIKINSVKYVLNFWKGVMDSSFPIILTDKYVQMQKKNVIKCTNNK